MQRLNEIEEQRREEEEERERAKDKRKFKRLGQANLSLAIQQTSALNDPSMVRARLRVLVLVAVVHAVVGVAGSQALQAGLARAPSI